MYFSLKDDIGHGGYQTLHFFFASCGHNCTWMVLLPHLLQHKQPLPHSVKIRGFGEQLMSWPEAHSCYFKGKKGFSVGISRVWSRDRKAVKQQTVLGASNTNYNDNNNIT